MYLNQVFGVQRELDRFLNCCDPSVDRGRNPAINIFDQKDEVVLKAELPGVDKKDLALEVEDDVLSIRGEVKKEDDHDGVTFHLKERVYGSFKRSFKLPYQVDSSKVKANLEDGVLTVKLGKRESAKAKTIEVS